ncbi:MAG: O-antigen ligase family protein [Bacteroidia bacterium]
MRISITPGNVSFFLLMAITVGLTASKAVLSIGMVVMLAAGAWHFFDNGKEFTISPRMRNYAVMLAGLFLIALICGLYTENTTAWLRDVKTKLSLLLIPLGLILIPTPTLRQKGILALTFIFVQTIWATATLAVFWKNYESEMEKVRQNSNIEILGSISHIYFGLLLAFACLLGLHFLYHHKTAIGKRLTIFLGMATIINLLSLHILSSRTAQAGFYAALLVWVGMEIWVSQKWKTGFIALSLVVLIPVVAFYTIPSFRTRIEVSVWDYQMYQNRSGIYKDNSISSRLLAWGEAWDIFLENPLTGIGLEDIGSEIERRFVEKKMYTTVPEHLKIPHNLYLKYLSGVGIAGFLYLLWILTLPAYAAIVRKDVLMTGFMALCMVAFFFENFPERQIGIVFFCMGYLLIPEFEP